MTFADLLETGHNAVSVGPLQHDEIDTGEDRAVRCVKTALWLSASEGVKFAVLVANSDRYSQPETIVEVAVEAGETGSEFSRQLLQDIEKLVSRSLTYRGKVISLEQSSRYSGEGGTIRVHKLHSVTRDQVILPPKTLQLLERNVMDFIAQRDKLHELGMASKKGLLFYGPPGTGKTHTIHYLASQLPEHTTLLITAGQVGLLEEYFLLARFMQPAMIIIEDADLIARDRETMDNPCAESLLNKLLNEMDGLRSDAAILFVLTTNRAEHLEQALASRPGRVDQAIEFPLPDEEGRLKLLKLYAGELKLGDEVITSIVKRTEGASAAFIKELMRRVAQYHLQNGNQDGFAEDVNLALEDMLFSGGKLNVKLLGGSLAAELESES
ncbi:MAG: 26S protease regulatory subunit [Cyanobacteria bacterium SZAS-4]|nr:26S protease regulatory subunit [Cyanobacteria bacterium SZAS-4]